MQFSNNNDSKNHKNKKQDPKKKSREERKIRKQNVASALYIGLAVDREKASWGLVAL